MVGFGRGQGAILDLYCKHHYHILHLISRVHLCQYLLDTWVSSNYAFWPAPQNTFQAVSLQLSIFQNALISHFCPSAKLCSIFEMELNCCFFCQPVLQ
jgi:hypothetical protein